MTRYRNTARDINSYPLQYRVWVTDGYPDLNAEFYTGLKSGKNDFTEIYTTAIDDDAAIVDFSLPDPVNWEISPKTLPTHIESASVLVHDGYAYLFGGKGKNSILRASLDNPGTWIDTGATLPNQLHGSSLAIVGVNVYLFGGYTETGPTSHVYSAAISDLLTWTDNGALLPAPLFNASLALYDSIIYLFGGQNASAVVDTIYRANAGTPLTWINTGSHLPTPLASSHFAKISDKWCLFGGMTAVNAPTSNIYRASTHNPISWTQDGNMPSQVYSGKFFTLGDQGYILAPTTDPLVKSNVTSIFQCDISDPLTWTNMIHIFPTDEGRSLPKLTHDFQIMIVADRLWILGGSGNENIITCEQDLSYISTDAYPSAYGTRTRTVLDATDNPYDPLEVLCFPYWITDYR